jgi:hypothetical protein
MRELKNSIQNIHSRFDHAEESVSSKIGQIAEFRCPRPVILVTQEAKIKRITV